MPSHRNTEHRAAIADRLAEQRVIQARCFHPAQSFVEFSLGQIEQSIPERFEQQAARHPHRIAVRTRQDELNYSALNRAANGIAHAILAIRGRRAEPVALLLEQGAPGIAAILGVLKAGRFYVSLDPSFPRARIAATQEDVGAELIITNDANFSLAEELSLGCTILNLDTLDLSLPAENPGLPVLPDSLAWILYTSGSTGRPKGVIQNHRGALQLIRGYTNQLHICPDDRLTLLHSFLTMDLFGALLNGAGLYPLDIRGEGLALLQQWLLQHSITLYRSFTTTFRQFVATLTEGAQFPCLRLIHIGGEPVYRRDVELYQSHFSNDCILVNWLGSNEAGDIACSFVDKQTRIDGERVPVWDTLDSSEVCLLDESGNEVAAGQPGEIVVRSRTLSPGYWRQPEETALRFRPDPSSAGLRVYHSGDLGQRLPDGSLVHLGRMDFQVKIRGYRIELAEVETALLHLDAVREGVAVARPDAAGEMRLVAYLVLQPGALPTDTDLRRALAVSLPEPMIPAAFVRLEALPLTANGKLDRQRLPVPGRARPLLAHEYVPPRGPVEAVLASIWEEVLGLETVGVLDPFLELGGNSLLATQVVTRVLHQLHVDLPARSLFATPTIAAMADQVVQHQARTIEASELERLLAELEAGREDTLPAHP